MSLKDYCLFTPNDKSPEVVDKIIRVRCITALLLEQMNQFKKYASIDQYDQPHQ